MSTDRTSPGAARIVKTARAQHVLTQAEVDAGFANIDVPWDAPFADLNYTCDQNCEGPGGGPGGIVETYSFTRTVNGVTVTVGIALSTGSVLTAHSIGIHD